MKWLQPDQYHWRREDARYYIDQALVHGVSRYTAWFKPHEGALAEHLGCRDDMRGAVELTKQHERSDSVENNTPTAQDSLF